MVFINRKQGSKTEICLTCICVDSSNLIYYNIIIVTKKIIRNIYQIYNLSSCLYLTNQVCTEIHTVPDQPENVIILLNHLNKWTIYI